MQTEDLLRREVQHLHALEGSLIAVFDQMDGRVRSRRAASALASLVRVADRHLLDLRRICEEEGWRTLGQECLEGLSWRAAAEADFLDAPPCPLEDWVGVALLRRAVHLKLPSYESARLLAIYAERPLIARTLRLALDDEREALERLEHAADLGVNLRSMMG